MPWRLAPRAALSLGLLGAVGLTASAALFRRPDSKTDPFDAPLQTLGCARVGSDAWSPLPGVEYTGIVIVELPPSSPAATPRGTVTLIVGDSIALDIEARASSRSFPFRRERMATGPGIGVPPDLWLEAGTPFDVPPELTLLTLTALERPERVEIALGRRAPRVLARLSGYQSALKTRVCAATRFAATGDGQRSNVDLADSRHFATGWYAETRRADGVPIRWMRAHGAIFVPSSHGDAVTVRVRAAPPSTGDINDAPLLSLTVNDTYDALTLPMSPGSHDYEWAIPAEAWVAGVNELLFSVSRTPRIEDTNGVTRGLALERLSVTTQ